MNDAGVPHITTGAPAGERRGPRTGDNDSLE